MGKDSARAAASDEGIRAATPLLRHTRLWAFSRRPPKVNRGVISRCASVLGLLLFASNCWAQSDKEATSQGTPATTPRHTAQRQASVNVEPRLRRWVEFQTLTLHARYRYLDSNRQPASHDPQYKEAIRARFNIDAKRRLTVNAGFFSGTQFIGTFDNIGLGFNDGDYHSHYLKQLFLSAAPITGVELQYGGIYVVRGESTEITTYDDDGYIVGQRITARHPKELFFDEVTATHGMLGPSAVPNLFARWSGLTNPNYTQLLVVKRVTSAVSTSADYSTAAGANTLRAAAVIRWKPTAYINSLRYEQYYRMTPDTASGFAVTAEARPVRRIRFSGGYTTIDERYDANTSRAKLNSERMQRGRRFFLTANIPIAGPLNAVLFFTRALPAPYELTNRTRVDVMFQYDLLSVLRRAGKV